MLNSDQVFVNTGFIVRLNRVGDAGALLVIAALHEFLMGLLQCLEVPKRVFNVGLHFNGILVSALYL